MANREEIRNEGRNSRRFGVIMMWVIVLIGVIFVGFLVYYTVIAPERIAAPTDVFDPATPSEGVGVPDGGELTNVPTQSAPDSPSRTIFENQ